MDTPSYCVSAMYSRMYTLLENGDKPSWPARPSKSVRVRRPVRVVFTLVAGFTLYRSGRSLFHMWV